MCRSTLIRSLALIAVVLALPAAAFAEAAAPPAPAAAAAPAAPLFLDSGACANVPAKVVNFAAAAVPAMGEGEAQPMLGCTASYNCVHGTIISCSSPLVGTCTSSGQGCGLVVCNGQATWCPGHCVGDHHCARFCDWSPNFHCDSGCCEC